MRLITVTVALSAALLQAAPLRAADNPDKLSLGLSYLGTGGNSSGQTGGVEFLYRHAFDPWGLEVAANFLRAEEDGAVTAKKLFGSVRGTRTLGDRLSAFASASYLEDRFAGLDPRLVGAGGVSYTFLKRAAHELAFDLGATWTRDELVGDGSRSYAGGVATARYGWEITKTARFSESLSFYPSFQQGSDWRVESQTGLQAAVSSDVALKLSYGFRYANRPVPGFRGTDTQTAASLVINFI